MMPQLFLVVSIGSGLEKIINKNLEAPSIFDLITSPDIFLPLLAIIIFIIIAIFVRKIFYKK